MENYNGVIFKSVLSLKGIERGDRVGLKELQGGKVTLKMNVNVFSSVVEYISSICA
jgi:hypothetical protein